VIEGSDIAIPRMSHGQISRVTIPPSNFETPNAIRGKISGYKAGTKVMYVASSQQNASNTKKIKKIELSPL
jgi:hypothetical protein